MDDNRKTPEDHYEALLRLGEALQKADGLKIFLTALARVLLEYDVADGHTHPENQPLNILDRVLEDLYENPANSSAAVEAAKTFRQVLGMHLEEMRMYRRPSQ